MPFTLGLTGMDKDSEKALTAAFTEANERLGERWTLVPEAEAEHVVVDMDSMYGPMSWLRLHAAGKTVIGMTSAARTQTEFRLGRPFDGSQVFDLLNELGQGQNTDSDAAVRQVEVDPLSDTAGADGEGAAGATPVMANDALATPEPPSPPANIPPATVTAIRPAIASAEEVVEAKEPTPAAPTPIPVRDEQTEEAQPPESSERDSMFVDWMRPGALPARVRYRRNAGPDLLIDLSTQSWHGPPGLKQIVPLIEGPVDRTAFETVSDDAAWASESAAAGPAQPLSRLVWLSGLVAGQGALLPDHDADGRYLLTKWPQTEREYPHHFRIATTMMKGEATVTEISEASGIEASAVADFINANLVTGFAQHVPEPAAQEVEPAKQAGLLNRLRGR